jgi:hypothetical protein
MTRLQRIREWFRPVLLIPGRPVMAWEEEQVPVRELAGRVFGRDVCVITARGVVIPIGYAPDSWTVVEFTRLLSEIDGLPETGVLR